MCLINALISCSFVTKTRRRITDDYVTYIDAHVSLDIDEIIKSFWFPEFQNFEHRGAKINQMLEMYDYKLGTDTQLLDNFMQSFANQVTDNRTTSTFGTSYKGSCIFRSKNIQSSVRMHEKGWPSHADQSQNHVTKVKTPTTQVQFVTIETSNYPYLETFYVQQIWQFRPVSSKCIFSVYESF